MPLFVVKVLVYGKEEDAADGQAEQKLRFVSDSVHLK